MRKRTPPTEHIAVRSWFNRFAFKGMVLAGVCGITWLNLTGFCYSQLRYVGDEELIQKTLISDWRKIMELAAARNPERKTISMSQFVRNMRVWGRVGRRSFSEAFRVDTGYMLPRDPRGVFRFFGYYYFMLGIVFDVGVGKEPYSIWLRNMDSCGAPYGDGYSDSLNDDKSIDKDWGLRRLVERDDKILISKDAQMPRELKK